MEYIKDIEITTNDDATVTIKGEIPFSELQNHREAAIEKLGKNVEIDGFRTGHVPQDVLEEKIGSAEILAEMAERALAQAYPSILDEHTIDAVGYPQVSLTKLAEDNPLGFTITVAVMPEINLPDYKTIASTHQDSAPRVEVSEEDIENATKDILRRKLAYERMQQKAAQNAENTPGESTDLPTPETVQQDQEETEPTDAELPELTDEVAKTLGDFATVDEFKNKLTEELTEQKTQEAQNKHRAAITDALIEATDITVPQVMVDAELEQFLAQMQEDLTRAQLSMDDYLAHIKKTKEELKEEWKPAAEKRAKVQLLLDAVATAENITPDQKLVDEQVNALKEQYKDADEDRVRTYVTSVLKNEAVMKVLEGKTDDTDAADTQSDSEEKSEKKETDK